MSRFVAVASLSHRKHPLRCRVSGQHDVGHEGVITGCDGFSLRSSIANPRGVAQSPLQSTYINDIHFKKMSSTTLVMKLPLAMITLSINFF
ncbi:hypothetical protein ABH966_005362 [Lysinibacillus sp. RC46]|uniref:hypothetical protein n=1 Tax=unclassified Lysinibacillus TaxID=2636778 RepID=UPI0035134399